MVSLPPRKFMTLLSSPFLLAAIPSLILILLLPVRHERYILGLKSSTQVLEGYCHSYCDLNGDGTVTGRTPVEALPYNSLMRVDRRNEPVYALLERDRGIVVLSGWPGSRNRHILNLLNRRYRL